ncbi:SusD/RagB family nutrient-binding outer membrane lipoprotein [Leeuwenhoekiella sp. W20_SRS_FM14]|uniref:SusD/RagB family nutrient-binding outer membrane lipoprotein n=1 Tax=Leeuwenhoekiella sp. W20_SRS_FM14 TaxID=3240270 RepID=UPI003F991415
MKNKLTTIFAIGLLIASTSCEDYSKDLNTDPNNFTDAPGSLVVGQAELALVKLSESQASRYAGLFTDQFSGCDRQYLSYEIYNVTTGDFDDDWGDIYVAGVAQSQYVQEKAKADGNAVLEGVAQILEATFFAEATALFGDVPFTEAGDPLLFPNPQYDSQADILDGVQIILSEAIAKVGSASVSANFGGSVFADNDATWSQIAHSLKARYFLLAKDYSSAYTEARLGISSASGDLLAKHGPNTGEKNLYFQFTQEQRGGYLGLCNDPYLLRLLDGSTPRLLTTPGDANRLPVYFDVANLEINTNSGGYFAIDATFPIISYVETKLIEAEAAARTSQDASTPFNQVRSYLANEYGGAFPASTSTGSQLINEILEEKYISLIGSLQVFHDARRTNNALNLPIKGATNTALPQRFLYPQSEINANSSFPGVIDLFVKTAVNN